jgi:hypothetical protein
MTEAQYVIYADESGHTDGRYKSVCLVTLEQVNSINFSNELSQLLSTSNISKEFKWTKLKDARYRFAAQKIIDFTFDKIIQNKLRIDVLTWDIEDYRHKNIRNRDDIANLQRMYFHLLKNVMSKQWTRNKKWNFMPDENSAIDWNKLQKILQYESVKNQYPSSIDVISLIEEIINENPEEDIQILSNLIKDKIKSCENANYYLDKITESCSKKYSLIQLADFFAGISTFSKKDYSNFKQWQESQSPQLSLLQISDPTIPTISFSNSQRERYVVLEYLRNKIKENKMKISFDSTQGLETRNPNENINFWLYKPQHVDDTAPVKSRTI